MATKADFTEEEWDALHKGLTGSGMLVSLSDRDFTDSFSEAGAMAKYLQGQQVAASSEVIRELAKPHGTGFGLTASAEKIRAETLGSLQTALAALAAKAPDDLDAYRNLVLGLAQAVAEAKGGVTPVEATMIATIRNAVEAAATA
jgi:hypothetical protein